MVQGYREAVARFSAAIREADGGKRAAHALFEALNWAHALDDLIAEIWRPAGERLGFDWRKRVAGAEVLAGIRYVRNRVHHDWADALQEEDGARFPMRFPVVFHSWIWRPVDELPTPNPRHADESGRDAYEEMLAGTRAEDVLLGLCDVFEKLMDFLEPRRPGHEDRR